MYFGFQYSILIPEHSKSYKKTMVYKLQRGSKTNYAQLRTPPGLPRGTRCKDSLERSLNYPKVLQIYPKSVNIWRFPNPKS